MSDTPAAALPPGTTDTGSIGTYIGWGGRPLRYRIVAPDSPRCWLVYLHGIESHGTWFLPAAAELSRRGCTTYLLDRRGSGLNREPDPGDALGAASLLADVAQFREHVRHHPSVHLVALSWGGKLALASALDHPEYWQSITLITPGLRAAVDLPIRHKFAIALSALADGRARFPVPLRPEMFTTTPQFLHFIEHDPWKLRCATARFWLASRALDKRIDRRGARLPLPMLVLLARQDRIVDNEGVRALVQRVQPQAAVTVLPADAHAVQFDCLLPLVDRMTTMFRTLSSS